MSDNVCRSQRRQRRVMTVPATTGIATGFSGALLARMRALCLVLAVLPAAAAWSQSAADYPVKPIRMVVGFGAGGISDRLARAIGSQLTAGLRQQVIVDNRPGAGTTIASAFVARSAPDGYTLFMQDITTHAINASLHRKLPYDSIRDFTPVSLVAATPLFLLVHPSLPVRNVKELIALAKLKPGQINYASAGNGTILQLAAEMLKSIARIDMVHIAYKGGGEIIQALMSGEAAVAFSPIPTALAQVKAGRLRAVAVTTLKRVDVVADVPTVIESGVPDFVMLLHSGVLGPPALPKQILLRINAELVTAVHSAEMKTVYASIGAMPVTNAPDEFAGFLSSEISKLGKVIKESGARID